MSNRYHLKNSYHGSLIYAELVTLTLIHQVKIAWITIPNKASNGGFFNQSEECVTSLNYNIKIRKVEKRKEIWDEVEKSNRPSNDKRCCEDEDEEKERKGI